MNRILTSIIPAVVCLLFLLLFPFGCSEDDAQINLNGFWTGRNLNTTTNDDWDLRLYFDQLGGNISGIYTDYRGGISMHDITYSGTQIAFTIDVYPSQVVFTGETETINKIMGTWVYSQDNTEGRWYVYRDDDNFRGEDEPEEDEDSESTSNPFDSQS